LKKTLRFAFESNQGIRTDARVLGGRIKTPEGGLGPALRPRVANP